MATLIPGKQLPYQDRFLTQGDPQSGVVSVQRVWPNDTSTDPKGVSPIKQDGQYFLSRMKPVFTDTSGVTKYSETTPILTKGSGMISPAPDVDHGPPEMEETLPMKNGEELLIVKEAVEP